MSDTKTTEQPAVPSTGSSLFGKVVVLLFMLAVIATECLIAYLLIPSADEVARRAEARMTEKIQKNINPAEYVDQSSTVEVDLGDYSITYHQAETNTSLRIDFKLVGVVAEADQGELKTRWERTKNRFRDQVIFEIRSADINDLSDPSLGLLKRRILEKSNQLLGRPILIAVVFSDFSFVEQ